VPSDASFGFCFEENGQFGTFTFTEVDNLPYFGALLYFLSASPLDACSTIEKFENDLGDAVPFFSYTSQHL
jgi:hypothetical protein